MAGVQMPSPPITNKPCHFFKLPPELRLEIYERVFDTTYLRGIDMQSDLTQLDPAPLFTCSQIYQEAHAPYDAQLGTVLKHAFENVRLCIHMTKLQNEYFESALSNGAAIDLAENRKLSANTDVRFQAAESVARMVSAQRERLLRFNGARLAKRVRDIRGGMESIASDPKS